MDFWALPNLTGSETLMQTLLQQDIKIQVSCDKKQSTLGSSSTSYPSFNEVRSPKICSTGQQGKSVDRLCLFPAEKT